MGQSSPLFTESLEIQLPWILQSTALLESTWQVQIIADSILPNNSQIQDPYSNFQVQPQQEKSVDLEKNMEFIIQSQNDCIQSQTDCLKSLNTLEAKVSHLVNTINDRNKKTLPNTFLTIPDSPSHIDEDMVSWRF